MHYFTETEAQQIGRNLRGYIGRSMKYEPNKEPSIVTGVEVQKTGHEIAVYGNIEFGYLVVIRFEKHPGLAPQLFCAFNGLTEIYASHEAINEGTKNQLITNKWMDGDWYIRDGFNKNLSMKIGNGNVTIKGTIDGYKEEANFSSDGHWLSHNVFMFMDSHYYIISKANQTKLYLHKLQTPRTVDGKYQWHLELDRIQHTTPRSTEGFAR